MTPSRGKPRKAAQRKPLPPHLWRETVVHEPDDPLHLQRV